MKKYVLATLLVACSMSLFAHVPMFGHRGGVWGVQNTSGTFLVGAKVFDGMETDVKVTQDGVMICCHDGSLSKFYKDAALTTKWTSSETSFSSHTWAQLRTKKFYEYNTWTKKTYGDTICTVAQFLDICYENQCIALIELKWTEGWFTSGTTKGMQPLMDLVEEHHMLNHCIIMSSMTNCLEWVRARSKYNHVPVEYLGMTGSGNPSYDDLIAWAKKTPNADIDPECYQIDNAKAASAADNPAKANIKKAHDNGIRVMCWNLTGHTSYNKYKGYGVDYMTSDSMRIQCLPDYTPRTGFLDVHPAGTVVPGEEEDIDIDTLPCNQYGWKNKGEMCLALQTDLNTASGCTFNFVRMNQDSTIDYAFADGWMNWKTAESQNKSVSMDEFLAGYTYSATVTDPVKNFIEASSKWAWLKNYIIDKSGLNTLSNAQWRANLSGFFLCAPAYSSYDSPDYRQAGKETSFAPVWGYRLCGDTSVTPTPPTPPTPTDTTTCNPYGWKTGNDMYQALAADVFAAQNSGFVFSLMDEFEGIFGAPDVDGNTGVAYDIIMFDMAFFTTSPYAEKWGWLLNYMDSRCTADGKLLPSSAEGYESSYTRYNLAAFFANSARTEWPQSANYANYGVNSTQYESTWGYKLVCPTTDIEEAQVEEPTIRKFMKDGRMYIMNGNRVYDIFGHEIE